MKPKYALILSLLITALIFLNIHFINSIDNVQRETAFVSRVIDGDTLELDTGRIIRLLNINTPEKNEQGYNLAKDFLKKFENKTIEIEEIGAYKYVSTLAIIYLKDYLNVQIVWEGLAKKFLVQQTELKEFASAEKEAIENEKGIWKKSPFYNCISSEITAQAESGKLENSCSNLNFKDFLLTDESRKKYKFNSIKFNVITLYTKEGEDNETSLFWNSKQNVFNDDRDTLYLFDKEGNIVYYNVYGY